MLLRYYAWRIIIIIARTRGDSHVAIHAMRCLHTQDAAALGAHVYLFPDAAATAYQRLTRSLRRACRQPISHE